MSKRGLVIGIVSISTVLFFASFFTSLYRGSAPRAKAEQENVNITMNPNVGTIGSDPQTITLIIQPTTAGNIISGVDLALAASGQLLIMDVAAPVGFPDDNQNVFTEVYKDVSGTNAHISYISTLADEQLPPAVKVEVTVAGNGAGNGALAVETSSTQIVGKIVGYVYGYNTVDNAQFTFTGDSNQYYLQNSSGKNLTVKIRLQGVLERPRYPATVPVKVTLIDTSGEQHVYTIPVQPETGGVWSGNAPIDAPEGDGYTALVKGAMHVQKKSYHACYY